MSSWTKLIALVAKINYQTMLLFLFYMIKYLYFQALFVGRYTVGNGTLCTMQMHTHTPLAGCSPCTYCPNYQHTLITWSNFVSISWRYYFIIKSGVGTCLTIQQTLRSYIKWYRHIALSKTLVILIINIVMFIINILLQL